MKHLLLKQYRRSLKYFYITQLKRHQYCSEIKLKEIQEKRLRKIIKHAYTNVQFYNELFRSAKIKPSDIKTVKDLKKLPVITKKDIQNNYPDKIIARNANRNKLHIFKTTGSTGTPLEIAFNYKDKNYREATLAYILLESGARWFDKIIKIGAKSSNLNTNFFNRFGVLKIIHVSIFNHVENIIKELNKLNPYFIFTFPSILSLIAKEINEKDIFFAKPEIILTVGETLTNSLRKDLCKIFGSEIFSFYGSEEFGPLAFECKEHQGYHIISDHVVMEFLKEYKDVSTGERGEVVVTGLTNYEMPLIRYKIGDIAIPSQKNRCHCGRRFPMFKKIVGREDDFVILPSGKIISPRMINVIENIPGIKEYQTIQVSKERFVVKLVKGKGFSERTISDIKQQIMIGCLGERVKIEVELVDRIHRERTGKIRAVVSKIKE